MPSMPDQVEEDLEFTWGTERKKGGKAKEVQFYQSFTYDGVDYSLFDSVYVFKDGEIMPYIGKLVKIWENKDTGKRGVKLLWFFYPHEILNYIRNERVLENELFLACGKGEGLANVNPLETIAGKCNVVCISRDERNRQPSEHELMVADHIFYRTFDVDKLIISDKLGKEIASVGVTDLLNRREPKNSILPNVDAVRSENGPYSVSDIGKGSVVERADPGGDKAIKDDVIIHSSMENEEKEIHFTEVCDNGVDKSGTKSISSYTRLKQTEAAAMDKSGKAVATPNTGAPNTVTRSSDAEDNGGVRIPVTIPGTIGVKIVEKPDVGNNRNGTTELKKGSKRFNEAAEGSGLLEVKRAKILKPNDTTDQFGNHGGDSLQNSLGVPDSKDKKAFLPSAAIGNKNKGKMFVEDSIIDTKPEKLKSKEQTNKVSGQKLRIAAANHLNTMSSITYGQLVEVTRRPEDKRKWFTPPPWEDEVKNATERGTLVLLMNLDSASASSEVEDIIWHGCQESCTAKMIARTAISSPHSGQAFAIFKTKEVAEKVIRKLEGGCLILPSGRPLVACTATANLPAKRNSFPGHLFIDKIKFQMQKNGAVSTSHGAQTNTLEYDMAREWRLHQERSSFCWKKLYKQQGEELRKLKARLKPMQAQAQQPPQLGQ